MTTSKHSFRVYSLDVIRTLLVTQAEGGSVTEGDRCLVTEGDPPCLSDEEEVIP